MTFDGNAMCPHGYSAKQTCDICYEHRKATGVLPVVGLNESQWKPWLRSTIVQASDSSETRKSKAR